MLYPTELRGRAALHAHLNRTGASAVVRHLRARSLSRKAAPKLPPPRKRARALLAYTDSRQEGHLATRAATDPRRAAKQRRERGPKGGRGPTANPGQGQA